MGSICTNCLILLQYKILSHALLQLCFSFCLDFHCLRITNKKLKLFANNERITNKIHDSKISENRHFLGKNCHFCTMTKKFSKAAKNQVLWFSNAKQSYSAFFVSILMYSNKVPRTFFNTWKLRLFSWSNSSILRNKEKVRHIKKLPIFWNSKICMDYNAKHHKKSEKTQN